MDPVEDRLLGRTRRRRWLMFLFSLPFVAMMAFGAWFFASRRQHQRNRVMVEQVTGAAFGCVAATRGDAPEYWGLELALEHMSRMERVTQDPDDPTTRLERERFARLARDAALGCERLGQLMMQAREEDSDLYFGVPAALAQPPDMNDPERWFRRVLPDSRPEAEELTRQIGIMAEQINRRRDEHALMRQVLPIEGQRAHDLAALVVMQPIPSDLERLTTEIWPTPEGVLALRRGSLARVPCEARHRSPEACYSDFLEVIHYDGRSAGQRSLERPSAVRFWTSFTVTEDATLWALGPASEGGGAIVGAYRLGENVAQVSRVELSVDGTANIVAVEGGLALFVADGGAWFCGSDRMASSSTLRFTSVDNTPRPIVLRPGADGPSAGVGDERVGRLSIFGSQEGGWTSRYATPDGEDEDILLRVIDAFQNVREVTDMRALRSGHTAVLVSRFDQAPDALILSQNLGRSWVTAPSATSAAQTSGSASRGSATTAGPTPPPGG